MIRSNQQSAFTGFEFGEGEHPFTLSGNEALGDTLGQTVGLDPIDPEGRVSLRERPQVDRAIDSEIR